ncbi:copper amine oxidase N-terminal domain-containing protein [Desulfitibacter alkalitolerans]|uniref:copper amine oxidase N-terminal domain-containing protein n=1 Tax=Desulfitibacter alkalitolerans TaxID=264641 RepID=UPI000685DDFF|nr:copper amine oxidase N-terminal domain-containing protein [Desulfitibacter alkalitolerans]
MKKYLKILSLVILLMFTLSTISFAAEARDASSSKSQVIEDNSRSSNIESNELQVKHESLVQKIQTKINSLEDRATKAEYIEKLNQIRQSRLDIEQKIVRLEVLLREINSLINQNNLEEENLEKYERLITHIQKLIRAFEDETIKNRLLNRLKVIENSMDRIETKIVMLESLLRTINNFSPDTPTGENIEKQYLSLVGKIRSMIARIMDEEVKEQYYASLKNIYNTRDTYQSKILRLEMLEKELRSYLANENITIDDNSLVRIQRLVEANEKEILMQLRERIMNRIQHQEYLRNLPDEVKREMRNRELKDRLYIRGNTLDFDVPPVLREGRTLVPVRAITEGLGAEVNWNNELKKITITKDDKIIELFLDSRIVLVNGEEYELDIPAQLINNRTTVPIRFVSEILGERVDFNEETGDIDIGLETVEDLHEILYFEN